MSNSPIITGKNITKIYQNLEILNVIEVNILPNIITSIVGPSGAGKSTLLHILGTLLKPSTGEVKIDDLDISTLDDNHLAELRNQSIGFVFQSHQLLPELNALENVCLPAIIGNRKKSEYELRAKELLSFIGLETRIHHKPSQMSGGEQQRVAIARALINEPKIIFADEPTGNLDTKNALEIHQLFLKLKDEFKSTFLIVTHNPELARMSDIIIEMKDGKIVNKI